MDCISWRWMQQHSKYSVNKKWIITELLSIATTVIKEGCFFFYKLLKTLLFATIGALEPTTLWLEDYTITFRAVITNLFGLFCSTLCSLCQRIVSSSPHLVKNFRTKTYACWTGTVAAPSKQNKATKTLIIARWKY